MEHSLLDPNIHIKFDFMTSLTAEPVPVEESDLSVVIMNWTEKTDVLLEDGTIEVAEPYTSILFGPHTHLSLSSPSGGSVAMMYFDYVGRYCDSKVCEYLDACFPDLSNTSSTLRMDGALKHYLDLMMTAFSKVPHDHYFAEIKYKEFFYMLCSSLSIEDFAFFLHPAMAWYDPVFRRKVLDHYEDDYKAKTLAATCGYSYSVFCDKFVREFGELPSSWIRKQVMEKISRELANPTVPIKEISDKLKMSSVQQFSRFCKNAFGKNPTQLRYELQRQ